MELVTGVIIVSASVSALISGTVAIYWYKKCAELMAQYMEKELEENHKHIDNCMEIMLDELKRRGSINL